MQGLISLRGIKICHDICKNTVTFHLKRVLNIIIIILKETFYIIENPKPFFLNKTR